MDYDYFFTSYESVTPPKITEDTEEDFRKGFKDYYRDFSDNLEYTTNQYFNNVKSASETEEQPEEQVKEQVEEQIENPVKQKRRQQVSYVNNDIVRFFMNKGLTENQARGIYGNLMQESGGNIRAISGDGYNSYGLAQWTGDRKRSLFKTYGTQPTFEQQLEFIWTELNSTHKSALEALLRTTTIEDATREFMNRFERPSKKYANFNRRLRFANSDI